MKLILNVKMVVDFMEMPNGKVIVANVIESIYKNKDQKQNVMFADRGTIYTFIDQFILGQFILYQIFFLFLKPFVYM